MNAKKIEMYETMSLKKLKDALSKLKKDTEQLGKELPNLEGVEREMRKAEYDSAFEEIDEIKRIIGQKQSEKAASKSDTMEKLFPTVMKVAHKKSNKNASKENEEADENTDDAKDIITEEDVIEAETKFERPATDRETLDSMYDDIRDILEDIDIEADKMSKEIKEKVSEHIENQKPSGNSKPIEKQKSIENQKPMEVEAISVIRKSDENRNGFTSLDELIEQSSQKPPVIDADMHDAFNGDVATSVLATTEEEIITGPMIVLSEDVVSNMNEEDLTRERYRMSNFKNALIKALNKFEAGSAERKECLNKITVVESNLSIIFKHC